MIDSLWIGCPLRACSRLCGVALSLGLLSLLLCACGAPSEPEPSMSDGGAMPGMEEGDASMDDMDGMQGMQGMAPPATDEEGLAEILALAREIGPAAEQSKHGVAFGGEVEVRQGDSVPLVSLSLTPDEMVGWNLHVQTANFRFAPENTGRAHVPGQGHGHLYLNGEKLARLYAPYFYLPALPPGEHEIEVRLFANNHAAYLHDGEAIGEKVRVVVPER